jgi:hypothetical protein
VWLLIVSVWTGDRLPPQLEDRKNKTSSHDEIPGTTSNRREPDRNFLHPGMESDDVQG